MAYPVAVAPAGGRRTWTVLGEDYATVGPVEEWIEAHRHLWSPNTVRGYATSLEQCWRFLEQRGQPDGGYGTTRGVGRKVTLPDVKAAASRYRDIAVVSRNAGPHRRFHCEAMASFTIRGKECIA